MKYLDYIRGGTSVEGSIFVERHNSCSFENLPTLPQTALGYQYNYIYTSANGSLSGFVGINNYINSGSIVLQMGYYLVQAYCLYTLTSSTAYFTTLGMNTKQSDFNQKYNYTRQYCPAIINLNQNINYQYFLQNDGKANFFFVFDTGTNTNGGQINRFNATFYKDSLIYK